MSNPSFVKVVLLLTLSAVHTSQPTQAQDLIISWKSRRLNDLGFGITIPKVQHIIPQKTYLRPGRDVDPSAQFDAAEHERKLRLPVTDPGNADGEAGRRRCLTIRGTWCKSYMHQERAASRPVPRGSKDCPSACSGWGNCNHDTGLCECPAGRGGPDCGQEVKRPCTNRNRRADEWNNTEPASHIGPDKLDLDIHEPGWAASRCFGYCEDDHTWCFCGEGTFRHIPAPPGSPPWTPPVQWGRPLLEGCMPGTDRDGRKVTWGRDNVKWEEIYGPEGWCNKLEQPKRECGCLWDGNAPPCDGTNRYEAFCLNQCSGHGDCHFGHCRCHPGWYGTDCSRKKAGLEMEPGLHEGVDGRKWLRRTVVTPPGAKPVPAAPTRPRPLIYVYDMNPIYTTRMLEYRPISEACMWRVFNPDNESRIVGNTYTVEVYLHEALLQSEHRTFDPEEADFFYVPMYIGCYAWPIMGWADAPWWYAPTGANRVMHFSNMVAEAQEWLASNHPWWNRRGGRDHIWLAVHDEGACYMPTHIFNSSIILTHWGRMDLGHKSNSAYLADNYTSLAPWEFQNWKGYNYTEASKGHPCYDPNKDLVIPVFKAPGHFGASPLLGAAPLERDILLYFRGDVGEHRYHFYSRGIRQRIFQLAHDGDWANKYKIYIGVGSTIPGSYSEHLARSKFCLVAPGDGFSTRAEDAVLHGCIPVVVMDDVHSVFESILDWDAFSVRVKESALEGIPHLLTAIPDDKLERMQRNLATVWHRFAYGSGPVARREIRRHLNEAANHYPHSVRAAAANLTSYDTPFAPATAYPFADDALGTIMQWLHSRIPSTR